MRSVLALDPSWLRSLEVLLAAVLGKNDGKRGQA